MDLKSVLAGRILKGIALVALLLGLADAARLLGVGAGPASPIATLGPAGFSLLAVFSVSRLFAAVGLWIRASWGGVLLLAATVVELVLYVTGNPNLRMDIPGFVIRVLLVGALVTIYALSFRLRRSQD
jgi:hypothetical protein